MEPRVFQIVALVKPFRADSLLERVRGLLEG